MRRSAVGARAGDALDTWAFAAVLAAAPAAKAPPSSLVPLSPQTPASGSFDAPQLGQRAASAVPQRRQNLRSERFSAPQFEQVRPANGDSGLTRPAWSPRLRRPSLPLPPRTHGSGR